MSTLRTLRERCAKDCAEIGGGAIMYDEFDLLNFAVYRSRFANADSASFKTISECLADWKSIYKRAAKSAQSNAQQPQPKIADATLGSAADVVRKIC